MSKITPEMLEWAEQEYKAGKTRKQIAKELGVHLNTITNYVKRKWKRRPHNYKFYTIYDRDDNIIAAGTARECAKQMGLTFSSFRSTLSKIRHGQRSTYEFVVDDTPYDEEDEI